MPDVKSDPAFALDKTGLNLVEAERQSKDIPTYAQPTKALPQNNRLLVGNENLGSRSLIFQAKQKERQELYQLIKKMLPDGDKQLAEFVGYIPNAKMAWANAVIKEAFRNQQNGKPLMSQCESSILSNLWMNKESQNQLRQF